MSKASSSQEWLWHRRLSHLNFDTINLLSKYDIVTGLSKLKFVKDHLFLLVSWGKQNTLHAYFAQEGIEHQTSTAQTPEQNSVVERWNRTLVKAARSMLSVAKVPLYFWAEAIAMACLTQNHGENLDKMKKGDACIFVGYSTQSRAYRVYNKRTRVIIKTIHVNFDELPQMASDHVSSDPAPLCPTTTLEQDSLSPGPQSNTLPLNIQTTPKTTSQAPTQAPTVTANENIIQAEANKEYTQVDEDEFINIFSTPVQERGETSSQYVDSLNMHTFYQQHPSEHHWTKDHLLEQVIGNPFQSIRTRRQLETDGEMYYALWEVIENGATLPITKVVKGVITEMPITSAEQKAQKRLEVKARSTLMMGISNEHQLNFNSIKDAKKLQKLVSQLKLLEEKLSQEDINQKLLRSLSPEWNTHVVVWRNKSDLDTMSMDDLYNNLKVQPNSPQLVHEDLEQIHPDDIEEMDLRWQMAILTMRARRFLKKIGRKLTVNGNKTIGFDKSKVECYNFHKKGHFAREYRALRNQDNKNKESSRRSVPVETSASIALVPCDEDIKVLKVEIQMGEITIRELRKKLEIDQNEKYDIQLNVDKFEHASKCLNKLIDYQIVDNYKKGLGYENYDAVPPTYTGNFMPPTLDLSFTGLDEFVNKPVVENYKAKSNEKEPKVVKKNDDAPIIEEWVLDNEEEDDYKEIDGGYVTFGGNLKGRKIIGKVAQSSSAMASLCISSGNLSSLAVGSCYGSGKSSLPVGMPCAFYSQQSSPKLDAPTAIKFLK
uniref:Integrase, catalytic region, zinc finger, CCHC-type, peptidase aspartic, catalytic n=1 Tax=Tanacetum cinerariifolium TaxID=118510 RepID=A0A6L2KH01_TANCI|nr:integrase, catalytic region, zinc finger, CCHC-type, peptidase aspartic, catalytic [Tanacetum cinerariifolium]